MSAIEIINYTDKSIAIKGDTKAFKDALKNLNGRWNNHLKYDNTKFSGWIFPKSRITEVEKVLGINNTEKMTDDEWHRHFFGGPLTSDVGCQTDFPITCDVGCQTTKKKKKIIIDDDDDDVPANVTAIVENFLVQKCPDINQLKRMSQLMPAYDMNNMTVLIEN